MGSDWKYWLYALKVGVGVWLIREMRPFVPEMRWVISWEGVVVGVAVFVIWVRLDFILSDERVVDEEYEGKSVAPV